MHTPNDPRVTTAPDREASIPWARAGVEARGLASIPAASPPSATVDQQSGWRSDIPAARAIVRHTLSLGALAAGLIEYSGWQIANRGGAGHDVVPLKEWALGAVGNLGGAVAIGVGLACIVMVLAAKRKRPLRAGAAAFAFGVAGFLGFLTYLVSLAF